MFKFTALRICQILEDWPQYYITQRFIKPFFILRPFHITSISFIGRAFVLKVVWNEFLRYLKIQNLISVLCTML